MLPVADNAILPVDFTVVAVPVTVLANTVPTVTTLAPVILPATLMACDSVMVTAMVGVMAPLAVV